LQDAVYLFTSFLSEIPALTLKSSIYC
jgi:hypothetical protein